MNQQELTFIARRSRGQGRAQRTARHQNTHTLNSDLTERCFLLHKTVGEAKQIYFCGDHKTVFKYYKPQITAAFAPTPSSKQCVHSYGLLNHQKNISHVATVMRSSALKCVLLNRNRRQVRLLSLLHSRELVSRCHLRTVHQTSRTTTTTILYEYTPHANVISSISTICKIYYPNCEYSERL